MGKIERMLESEWESEIQELGKMKLGSEEYKITVDGVTKLTDRMVELKKLEQAAIAEEKNREFEENYKLQQLQDEKKDRIIKNIVNGVSVIGGLVAAVGMGLLSMKFERTDTITTSVGKRAFGDIFKFKH